MTLIVAVDDCDGARDKVAVDARRERLNLAPTGERSLAHQDRQLHRDHRGPSRAAIFVNPMLKEDELGERFLARGRLDFNRQLQTLQTG